MPNFTEAQAVARLDRVKSGNAQGRADVIAVLRLFLEDQGFDDLVHAWRQADLRLRYAPKRKRSGGS